MSNDPSVYQMNTLANSAIYTTSKPTNHGSKVYHSINSSEDEQTPYKSVERVGSMSSLDEGRSQFQSVLSSQVNLFKDNRKTSLVEQIKRKDSLKRLNNKARNS